MASTKYSGLAVATAVNDADQWGKNEAGISKSMTASLYRAYATGSMTNYSTSTVSAGFAADTYLAGSAIFAPAAGAWKVGTRYCLRFDMTKTAAGTAAPVLTIRMGTLGTTADAAILTFNSWSAGTAAADTGYFELYAHFRTVGGGTSAVMVGNVELKHTLAATGLTTSNLNGWSPITLISAGFNSTTQTVIGASFNGGASFSGTCNAVQSEVLNL